MRILILGGNGMIGHKMYKVLSNYHYDTWVTIKKNYQDLNCNYLFKKEKVIDNFNLCDFNKLNNVLDNINPDVIINAAGITIRRGIDFDISKSIIMNAALPHFLNQWVIKYQKRLIHFSTDCVFSGKDGYYSEISIPDSIDIYGRTKTLGEINSHNSLTIRSSMIGRELENKTELFEWFLSQKNNKIKGFTNVIYSGITTNRMAQFILDIINLFPNMHGLFNVSSFSISKYELLKIFNNKFENNVIIEPDESYHSNKSLDSSKFYDYTGFKKPNWEELIIDLK